MAEPTKAELQQQLAEAQAQLADRRPHVIVGLHAVLADMPEMLRREVKGQGFSAFNVDDVYATVRPLFIRHALVVIPYVRKWEYRVGAFKSGAEFVDFFVEVEYVFVSAIDGSRESAVGVAEGRDSQDKGPNKAMQQALKYVLIQMLQINTGEDAEEDPGEGSHAVLQQTQQQAPPPPTPKQLTNAAKEKLLELLNGDADEAKQAWPLVLERAGIEQIKTAADKKVVVDTAVVMFDEAAAPFDESGPHSG